MVDDGLDGGWNGMVDRKVNLELIMEVEMSTPRLVSKDSSLCTKYRFQLFHGS